MTDFHETTVRVRYAETDQMGVVYHSNFFVWFEVGRVEMLRSLGVSYKKPARYDDVLRIRTRVAEARTRTMRFSYEVFNDATGDLLATGETHHVVCDSQGRPKTLPDKYRPLLGIARGEGQATPN